MWFIIECQDCGSKKYLYGNIKDWTIEDFYCRKCENANCRVMDRDDFTSKDVAVILGNELEAGNLHHLVNIPIRLLEVLNSLDIEEEICKTTMEKFTEMIWEEM